MSLISALGRALELARGPALIFGKRTVSPGELTGQANALRERLRELGVRQGDRVALLCPNHPAFVVAELAVLAAGAILVPLNPLYRPEELSHMLDDADVALLICFSLQRSPGEAAVSQLRLEHRPSLLLLEDPELEPENEAILKSAVPERESSSPAIPRSTVSERDSSSPAIPRSTVPERDSSSPAIPRSTVPERDSSSPEHCHHRIETLPEAALEYCDLPSESPAVFIYTSGTTGKPKAAMLSHGNLEFNGRYIAREWLGGEVDASGERDDVDASAERDDVDASAEGDDVYASAEGDDVYASAEGDDVYASAEGDEVNASAEGDEVEVPMQDGGSPRLPPPSTPHRTLGVLPLCHNFGLNVSLNATLLHGGTLIILPRFSAVETIRAIESSRISFAPLVPTMVQAMIRSPELKRRDLSSLELLVSGGAALPGKLREQLRARLPKLVLRDTYGLSEASLAACTRPGDREKVGTVGRPIDETEIRVLRPDGSICEIDEVGEIVICGPSVMNDYWRRPVEAKAPVRAGVLDVEPAQGEKGCPASIDTPLRDVRLHLQPCRGDEALLPPAPPVRDGWLFTGDLGRLDEDGDLTIVDRKKDLILHGGYNIYPLEVEEVLLRCPSVVEAAVFGLPDPRMGEKVAAAVVLDPGTRADTGSLKSFCRSHLAEYKVPTYMVFRNTLPRGNSGKILRRLLREQEGAKDG